MVWNPVSQVHKAKLRTFSRSELAQSRRMLYSSSSLRDHVVQPGEDVWAVSNLTGTSYQLLEDLNKGEDQQGSDWAIQLAKLEKFDDFSEGKVCI